MYAVAGGDPGVTGGVVQITKDGLVFVIRFARTSKLDAFRAVANWAAAADLSGGMVVYKENMNARPGQSTQTVMANGRSHQFLEDLLIFNEIPYHLIDAKEWQFEFGLGGKQYKGANWSPDKEYRARKKAQQAKAIEIFGEGITQDIADAYLIAEFAWRKTFGELKHGRQSERARRVGRGLVGPSRSESLR